MLYIANVVFILIKQYKGNTILMCKVKKCQKKSAFYKKDFGCNDLHRYIQSLFMLLLYES